MNLLKEEILKKARISRELMNQAMDIHKKKGISLRRALVEERVVSSSGLKDLFDNNFYMPGICLDKFKFDPSVTELFPEHIARFYNAVPLFKESGVLFVATSEPLNVFLLDELSAFCRCGVRLILAQEDEISWAIDSLYDRQAIRADGPAVSPVPQAELPPADNLAEIILAHALKKRASDIHIEPEAECLRVRYRVDGSLRDVLRIPKKNQDSILGRLKLISGFDIGANRLPQDGKLKLRSASRETEFRVSCLPTAFGQKFVLHALDRSMQGAGVERLGFSESDTAVFKAALARHSGLILLSGPVGSGKTATIYSLLNHLNTPSRNIVTIEDPIEYQIDGITQIQVSPEAGLDMRFALDCVSRQEPDVLMIEQIRDYPVASAAVKAALSGRLVLSTIQSDDVSSAIGRLIEMGVEPFLAANSLSMVCYQRLARKNCPKCRRPANVPRALLGRPGSAVKSRFYTAQGCDYCSYTGFFGRVVISETILIDDAIRDIIISGKPVEEIRKYISRNKGFKSMRDNALLKARDGLISPEEAARIISGEQ
jgi:type IV pilus assembly protein PilB